MKVFFLNPPLTKNFSRGERSPQVAKSKTLYFPVWLALAASYIEGQGHTIDLMDAVPQCASVAQCIDRIAVFEPDLLVVDTVTASCEKDFQVVESIKTALPALKIALVGSHVSALPKWSLEQCPAADFATLNEYELPLRNLLAVLTDGACEWSSVKGVAWRGGDGDIIVNEPEAYLEDLDEIPFVSSVYKRFLNYRDYYFAAAAHPGIMLMTGRGCPNRCMWCLFNQTLHGRRYRTMSPRRIVAEFEYIIENFPDVRELWIEDDTFTANGRHLDEVCELIIAKKLSFQNSPFKWYCNARPPLRRESLKLMKEAGCRLIVVGFESGSAQILKNLRKGYTLEQGRDLVRNARENGILIHGCFMVGNMGETSQTMEETLQYAKRILPDSAQFYFVHPYPGTDYYKWAKDNAVLLTEDYTQWLDESGQHRCVIRVGELGPEKMTEFCNRAYSQYHFAPRYLCYKIKQLIVSPSEGWRSLRAGINLLRGSLRK